MAPIVGSLVTVPHWSVGDSFWTNESRNYLNEGDRFESRDCGLSPQQETKYHPHFTDAGLEVTQM